ncbi:hypothetical protein GCM10023116_19580 [Kistimonas scapharcae]|uniref:Uncharacterized protein n=1 Tax=Kistimonas scapharcae TaxID=1036133 RepID=A0ABP8V2P4_9GAMM
MIEVTEKDIGRRVVYRPDREKEPGFITSYNKYFVFVQYEKTRGDTSMATRREDLVYTG